jgi:hypothetical protein
MADDLTLMCLGQFVEFPVPGGPSFATVLDAAIRMVDDHPARLPASRSLDARYVSDGREFYAYVTRSQFGLIGGSVKVGIRLITYGFV